MPAALAPPPSIETYDIQIRIAPSDDGSAQIVASPRAPFIKHLRGATSAGQWLVRYKLLQPQSSGVENGDSLVFAGVQAPDVLPLIETLYSVAQFSHRLCRMMGELRHEIGPCASIEDDALHILTELGQVDAIHEADVLCVFAKPMHKVFGPRIRWENDDTENRGVLTHGEHVFSGVEESEDDSQIMFTFQYPEDDTRIRQLVTALAQILFAAGEQQRA